MSDSVPLNSFDRFMLLLNDACLRRVGGELTIQTHLRFSGRISQTALAETNRRLCERWPLLTAELVRGGRRFAPSWSPRTGRVIPTRVRDLEDSGQNQLLTADEALMFDPLLADGTGPCELVVLRAPDGNDTLVLRASHVLLDYYGLRELILQLLGASQRTDRELHVSANEAAVKQTLCGLRADTATRREARGSTRIGWRSPVRMPDRHDDSGATSLGRISLHWLEADDVVALQERIRRIEPRAHPIAGYWASALRLMQRRVSPRDERGRCYSFPQAYNLRRTQDGWSPFQNLASRVHLQIDPSELAEWGRATGILGEQFRAGRQASNAVVYRAMQGFDRIRRWSPRLAGALSRWAITRGSLLSWFCPELVASGTPALGASFEFGWSRTICHPPRGLVMSVHAVGDRHLLALCRHPSILGDAEAHEFGEALLEDLRRESAAG